MAKQTYRLIIESLEGRRELEFKTLKQSDKALKEMGNYKTKALKHAYFDKLIKDGIAKLNR